MDEMSIDLREQLFELLMLDIRYFGVDSMDNPIPQTTLHPSVRQFLIDYPLGGVILFQENFKTPEQIMNLTQSLQENCRWGRLIAIDEEGGVVSRIPCGFETPGNMALGVVDDVAATQKCAAIIAEELSYLGINLNLAPVVDVNSHPDNPIIGARSFGSEPELVARHGGAFINGTQQHVLACAKHFPGHGDTVTDTHLGMACVSGNLDRLENNELVPFKAAIKAGVACIMVAHVVVPALDDGKIYADKNGEMIATPATLSHKIVTTLLRDKLNFSGAIIADALDMRAISDKFTPDVATILALKAGIDIIVMPVKIWSEEDLAEFKVYFMTIYQACLSDPELQADVNKAYLRVCNLKKMLSFPWTLVSRRESNSHQAHMEYLSQLAREAITVYKDENHYLPFNCKAGDRALIIGSKEKLVDEVKQYLIEWLKDVTINTKVIDFSALCNELNSHLRENDNQGGNDNAEQLNDTIGNLGLLVKEYTHVIVLTYNLTKLDQNINHLFMLLNKSHIPYAMLSCRNPYDIRYTTEAKTIVLAYGATGFDQTSYQIKPFTLNLHSALNLILHLPMDFTEKK